MKAFKIILAIIVGSIFLFTSSGLLIFKTHCSCTNSERVSFYVTPETCATDFHQNHTDLFTHAVDNGETHECEACKSHNHDCGCDSPVVKFIKLKNQIIDEELEFIGVNAAQFPFYFTACSSGLQNENRILLLDEFYIDPPPIIKSSLDYLIQIQQLKIPVLA